MKKIVLYIYRITNIVNNKIYIGKHSSKSLENNYYGSGIAIRKAIKKYGRENFKKEIVCICDNENELNKMEIFFIEKDGSFRKGYNMTKGGEGILGHIQSAYTKAKASESRKLFYKNNQEVKQFLSDKAKGRVGNKNSFFGKKLPKEHIEKLTSARIKAITGENNPSARKVRCIEKDIIFGTAKDAAVFCGLASSTTILKASKGQRKTAGGFTWELLN